MISVSVKGPFADWRVEFEQPRAGDYVVVDLYLDGVIVKDHDVRWYNQSAGGSYLGNYSRSGLGRGLVGDPLFALDRLICEQLGINAEDR